MTKVLDAVRGLLGRTPLGREVLDAAGADEERILERKAAREKLDTADALEDSLPALEADVRKAEAELEEATERLGLPVVTTRRAYREAISTIDRHRGRALHLLRRTPPAAIAENGPIIDVLQRAIEHLRTHLSTENERIRERLADFDRAGEPKADRDAAETARAHLKRADWATTCATAVTEALEAVREAQLEVEPDVSALTAELLEDVLVSNCTCGHDFHLAEAFDTPRLAIA